MPALPDVAALQCGVFALTQVDPTQWTPSALRHALRIERIRRLRRGAYQVIDLTEVQPGISRWEQARWRHAAPGVAAVLVNAGAQASHSTAAVLLGVPLIHLPARACLTLPPGGTGDVLDLHLHRCAGPIHPPSGEGIGCTSLERTVVDLAREHGVAAGVVAADSVLHSRTTTVARLERELDLCRGWPGVRAAREAVEFADGRSESVLESRSRLALRDWGVPAPEPQVNIGNHWGGFVARVDFYWDEFGVVGEADGDLKYDGNDAAPLIAERKRQGRIEDLDLPVVRWRSADLHDFGSVVARLERAFARAAQIPRTERRWTVLPPLCPPNRPYVIL